jgi:hypothetical protein
MFVSALSITTTAFGALQRLDSPLAGQEIMPKMNPLQQMQTLMGEMYALLQTLMGRGQVSDASTSTDSSPTPISNTNSSDLKNVRGSQFGKKLAAQAEKTANQINTPGLCLKGANDAMQAMGLPVHRQLKSLTARFRWPWETAAKHPAKCAIS